MPTPASRPRASRRASAPACSGAHARELAKIRWTSRDVARFLGAFLSEPKADVFFDPPQAPLSQRAFASAARRKGVHLDRRTQWLFDDEALYANGEARPWRAGTKAGLATLANARALSGSQAGRLPGPAIAMLYEDYRHGSLHLG